MILNERAIDKLGLLDRQLRTSELTIYWRGFVYIDGLRAGEPSIKAFAVKAASDLPLASTYLKGNYLVAVEDHRTGDRYAFVDSSAQFQAFFSKRRISTSFLALAAEEGLGSSDLDSEALVEFLHFGNVYFGRTFFAAIRKLQGEDLLCLRRGQGVTPIPRPVAGIASPPALSFLDCLRSFSTAAASEKISLDLTGGIDSRLLAAALHSFGIPIEAATSGSEETPDVVIAREVADVLGIEHHVFRHDASRMESSLEELFCATDGLCDLARSFRAYEAQKEREARGVTLMVSGAGGELYKEFWWLQDFPFYRRREPQLERLFDFRICAVPLNHSPLEGVYRRISEALRSRILSHMQQFIVRGNTQTYDHIYYSFKMREFAGRFLSNYRDLLQCYAPYLERETVRCGYHLPRRQRFFNFFHRRTLTGLNRAAARVRSTEGQMTVSSEPIVVLRDISRYVGNRMSRLACKLRERSGSRTAPAGSPDDPRLRSLVRDLPQTKAGMRRLKGQGVLTRTARINELTDTQIGAVLSLGLLFDFLEKNLSEKISAAAASYSSARSK